MMGRVLGQALRALESVACARWTAARTALTSGLGLGSPHRGSRQVDSLTSAYMEFGLWSEAFRSDPASLRGNRAVIQAHLVPI